MAADTRYSPRIARGVGRSADTGAEQSAVASIKDLSGAAPARLSEAYQPEPSHPRAWWFSIARYA